MKVRATGLDALPVAVSDRSTWLLVRLATNAGVAGLGEASLGAARELRELATFYHLLDQPLSIQAYRQAGLPMAAGGRRAAAAFSAIEMALWDIRGKLLDAPVHELLGGRVRDSVAVYANINRMTKDRSAAGFADSAALALEAGFQAFKAAPFDGFPRADAPPERIEAAIARGIGAMFAIREKVGADATLKVDCHSHFDIERAVAVAQQLEPVGLDWYEEPLPIADLDGTRTVRDAIAQRLAGGESLFGLAGFLPLLATQAVDVPMPDAMLCGGVLEMLHIARAAQAHGIAISPHNPCGPVATAASLAVCAAAPNVESLELQWGEVDWRAELLEPPERIVDGRMSIPDRPGFGIELDESAVPAA